MIEENKKHSSIGLLQNQHSKKGTTATSESGKNDSYSNVRKNTLS